MQTATICQQISIGHSMQAAAASTEKPHIATVDEFMPPRWVAPPKQPVRKEVLSDEELARRLDQALGAHRD